MKLTMLKGWLRRIAAVEDREKKAAPPDTPAPPVRIEAERSRPVRHAPDRHTDVSGKPRPPADKQAAVPSSVSKARLKRTTRQGIPILAPDEDLAHHFLARADVPEEAPSQNVSGHDAPEVKSRPGPVDRHHPAKGRRKRPCRNRSGIRQLDTQRDLSDYFLPAASEESATGRQPAAKTEGHAPPKTGRRPKVTAATDRHGIPRLDDQTDLRRVFEAALEEDGDTAAGQELGKVFRASLDHDAHRLMKKKTGGFFAPRRLSLKEKLRRYPAPQAQLDLHGDTALIAQQRADSFLRMAGAAGTLTVRIIVGKGLHSEDGAVLPDVVEDLLVALKRDGRLLAFRWDKGLKRKSGAVIVYLEPPF